jgi:hypothetical protein
MPFSVRQSLFLPSHWQELASLPGFSFWPNILASSAPGPFFQPQFEFVTSSIAFLSLVVTFC